MYEAESSFGKDQKIYYNHEAIFGNDQQQQTNTFRLSQNHYHQPKFGSNQIYQSQHSTSKINLAELQCLHKISIARVQIQMRSFINLLNLKFLNLKSCGFKQIKSCQNSIDMSYSQSKFSNQIVKSFTKKLQLFVKIKRLKEKASAFQYIKRNLIQFNFSCSQNRLVHPNSTKQINKEMRVVSKSKIERRQSQIEQLNDTRGNLDKKSFNKQLKKKKERQNQNLTYFYSQMSQLLSAHEVLLSKIK